MEAYKERFIKEYTELSERITKLDNIIIKYIEGTLDFTPDCPIDLLIRQSYSMGLYKRALEERASYEHINLKGV